MTIEQRQTSPLPIHDLPKQWAFRVAALGMVIVLLSGCVTLLWQMQLGSVPGHAVPAIPADVSVVGPPSLSAATINAIFTEFGSPMAGTGATVETLSRQYNIDDAFALGVWWTETNDGMAGVGSADRNPGSVRGSPGYPSAWDGYTIYPSYTAAIIDWFNILNGRYIHSGLTTVFSIARPYVGTSSYPLWAGKVIALIYRYRGIAPPPPPVTPTPKPKPKPIPTLSPAMVVQKHRQATLLPREADFAYVSAGQGLDTEAALTAPAQIASPVTPVAPTQPASLSPALLYIIIFAGLLAALLIALYAQSIGRGVAVKAAVTTNGPDTASQSIVILSPVDTEAALALAGAAAAMTSTNYELPRHSIPMLDVMPISPTSSQEVARWLPAPETTTGELNPLPLLSPLLRKQFTTPPLRSVSLPAHPRQTDALPRPTIFLPSHSNPREPVTVGAATNRPGGLLSRYKEEKQA
ncbi:MAG TPA: hypothetical protein VNG51_13510 [Ktedonobacteraceae bacterium]|nr:hypothetical protein [Ktedonobacteraceae bacterium]